MENEEWKNFPVIGGRKFSKYEASSLGRIRNKKSNHISSTKPNSSGYICNKFLDDEGNHRLISAHIVVARAFLGEPESNDLTIDHINRERADNRLINLRWATKRQQSANSDKSKCGPKGQPVIQYTMDMEEIKIWPNITTVNKELGLDGSSISKVCRGRYSHAGGFKWAYERQDLDGRFGKSTLHLVYKYLTWDELSRRILI